MVENFLYSIIVVMAIGYFAFWVYDYYANKSAKNKLIGSITFKSEYTNKVINTAKSCSYDFNLMYVIKENKDKDNLNKVLNSNEKFRESIAGIYYYGSSKELQKLMSKVSQLTLRLKRNLADINNEKLIKIFNDHDIYIHLMSKNSEEEVRDELNKIISELTLILEKVSETKSLYKTIITNDYKLELEELLVNFVNEHLNDIGIKLDMDFNVDLLAIFNKENMATKLKNQKEINKYNKKSKLSEPDRFKVIKESLSEIDN